MLDEKTFLHDLCNCLATMKISLEIAIETLDDDSSEKNSVNALLHGAMTALKKSSLLVEERQDALLDTA